MSEAGSQEGYATDELKYIKRQAEYIYVSGRFFNVSTSQTLLGVQRLLEVYASEIWRSSEADSAKDLSWEV